MELLKLIVPAIYLILVSVCYWVGYTGLFFILTLPWTIFVSLLSFLIVHTADDGQTMIDGLQLTGAIANAVIFWGILNEVSRWSLKKSRPDGH